MAKLKNRLKNSLFELNFLNPHTFPLNVGFAAYAAQVPEVSLLGLLLASHLPLRNGWLAITAKVATATSPASPSGPYLRTVLERAWCLLLCEEHLVLGVLPAGRAETLD